MRNDYAYDPNHPHAAVQIQQDDARAQVIGQYTYDLNGNMACRMEDGSWFIQTFSAENRLATVTKLASGDCSTPGANQAVWNFSYDGDGKRVAQAYTPYDGNGNPQATAVTAYFMGGAYEVTGSSVRKYYAVAGMTVALNDGSGLKYLLTDHLGSVVAITDNSGTLINQQRYLPFGQVRTDAYVPNSPISSTDFGFTGQRSLDAQGNVQLGLMDYRARMYDDALGRFIQPDSIIPGASPQALNRYSYVGNDPINAADPSGHMLSACGKGGADCGGPSPNLPTNPTIPVNNGGGGKNNGNQDTGYYTPGDILGHDGKGISTPINPLSPSDSLQNPISIYCLDSSGPLSCAANFTQDIATLISMTGAAMTWTLAGIGCFSDPEVGFLPGCAGGYALGVISYNIPILGPFSMNVLQGGFSTLSLILTGLSDLSEGNTSFNFPSWNPLTWNVKVGESTATSATTTILSDISVDPTVDTLLNGYGTGYNHGLFCGIYSLASCIKHTPGSP